ncbi:hypothetical protein U1Q18_041612 [Sarracenia purpurea var. burkii]
MGNYKFRLSDMMPNTWFYKLRDTSIRTRNHKTSRADNKKLSPPPTITTVPPQNPHLSPLRHYSSRHHTRRPTTTTTGKLYNSPTNPKAMDTHFPVPSPRKSSSKQRTKRKTTLPNPSPRLLSTSSVSLSADCSYPATFKSVRTKPEQIPQPPPDDQEDFLFFSNSSDQNSPDTMDAYGTGSFKFNGQASSSSCSSCRCSCCRLTSSTSDIILDPMNDKSYFSKKVEKLEDLVDTFSELELRPILTKPVKFKQTNSQTNMLPKSSSKSEDQGKAHSSFSIKIIQENTGSKTKKETKTITSNSLIRKSVSSHSPGVKLRAINSPRSLSGKKKVLQSCGRRRRNVTSGKSSNLQRRKSFWESFVIVKSSLDPQRDFEESMVEMIVENKIRDSKDLEELLACYLLFNSNEYHETIVKAFQKIWFDRIGLWM